MGEHPSLTRLSFHATDITIKTAATITLLSGEGAAAAVSCRARRTVLLEERYDESEPGPMELRLI